MLAMASEQYGPFRRGESAPREYATTIAEAIALVRKAKHILVAVRLSRDYENWGYCDISRKHVLEFLAFMQREGRFDKVAAHIQHSSYRGATCYLGSGFNRGMFEAE